MFSLLSLLTYNNICSGANAIPAPKRSAVINGVLVMDDSDLRLLSPDETLNELELPSQTIRFTSNLYLSIALPPEQVTMKIMQALQTKAKVKVRAISCLLTTTVNVILKGEGCTTLSYNINDENSFELQEILVHFYFINFLFTLVVLD